MTYEIISIRKRKTIPIKNPIDSFHALKRYSTYEQEQFLVITFNGKNEINHPSGNLIPLTEDISITKRIIDEGNILGINVIDHVIINRKNYYSFRQNGLMSN